MTLDREPSDYEVVGMTWCNGLSESARALWLHRVGSAVAADARAMLKADPGIAFEIGVQEGQELVRTNADGAPLGTGGLTFYCAPTDPTRH